MKLFTLTYLLAAVSMAMGAAFHQRQNLSSSSGVCGQSTITVTESFTLQPPTVTVVLENPAQISAALSSGLSIESMYLSDQSELRPISEPIVTLTHKLTFGEVVPVIMATLTSSPTNNTGPYYVSVGPSTTDWSLTGFTPVPSMTIGTTTITLSPLPSTIAASPTTTVHSTYYTTLTTRKTDTSTIHHPFTLSTGGIFPATNCYGWNSTNTSSAVAADSSGSVGILPIPLVTYTTITNLTTVILTANITAYPTISPTSPISSSEETGYGYGFGLAYPSPSGNDTGLDKRQTCTLVYATLNGDIVSWCNNWDGSTVVIQTSFRTTYTPVPSPPNTPSAASTLPDVPSLASSQPATLLPPSFVASASAQATPTSTTASSAAAATTSCGLSGAFVINFDELPAFSPPNNDTADFPPIFNPFDHLYWSDGWSYVPPPNEPYPPQNGTHLGEYVPYSSTNSSTSGSPDAGDVPDGAIGAGPRNYNSAYWFNAESAYIGCDNGAIDVSVTCDFVATGYKYNAASGHDEVVVTEHFRQPPCPNFANCELRQIFFSMQFQGLSAISFYAVVQGVHKIFFIDTIEMGWWNNTCAAGLERASGR